MKKLTLVLLAIFIVTTAIGAPAKQCTVTSTIVTFNDPVIDLQIATAYATGIADAWPGVQHNYQLAYSEWTAVNAHLERDIRMRDMKDYRLYIAQLARSGPMTKADAEYLTRLSYKVR